MLDLMETQQQRRFIILFPSIDFWMRAGTPVRATGSGFVARVRHIPSRLDGIEIGSNWTPQNSDALEARVGLYIAIEHADGPYSVYKHLSEVMVTEGEYVESGSGDRPDWAYRITVLSFALRRTG